MCFYPQFYRRNDHDDDDGDDDDDDGVNNRLAGVFSEL